VKVLWTNSAVAQLKAIHDYIAQTSPDYAVRIVDRLTRRSIQIATFPNSGRMVPEYERNDIREVLLTTYPPRSQCAVGSSVITWGRHDGNR
jgi:toxin ParE1/3/4